jgi:hypothetical protein
MEANRMYSKPGPSKVDDKYGLIVDDERNQSLHTPPLVKTDGTSKKKTLTTTIEIVLDDDDDSKGPSKKFKPSDTSKTTIKKKINLEDIKDRPLTPAEQRALSLQRANENLSALLSGSQKKRLPTIDQLHDSMSPHCYPGTQTQPETSVISSDPARPSVPLGPYIVRNHHGKFMGSVPRLTERMKHAQPFMAYKCIRTTPILECMADNCGHKSLECIMFKRNTKIHADLEKEKSWKTLIELIYRKKLTDAKTNDGSVDLYLCCCHFTPKEVHAISMKPIEGYKLYPTNFQDGMTPMCYRDKLFETQKTYNKGTEGNHDGVPKKLPPASKWNLPKFNQLPDKVPGGNTTKGSSLTQVPATLTPTSTSSPIVSQVEYIEPPKPIAADKAIGDKTIIPVNHVDLLPTHGEILIRGCTEETAKKFFDDEKWLEPLNLEYRGKKKFDDDRNVCLIPYCRHNSKMCNVITFEGDSEKKLRQFFERKVGVAWTMAKKTMTVCACHYKKSDVIGVANVKSRYNYQEKKWILYCQDRQFNFWEDSSVRGPVTPKIRIRQGALPVWDDIAFTCYKTRVESKQAKEETEAIRKKFTKDQYIMLAGKFSEHKNGNKANISKETFEKACQAKFLMTWDAYEHIVNIDHHPFPSVVKLFNFMKDYEAAQDSEEARIPFKMTYSFSSKDLELDLSKVRDSLAEFGIIEEKERFDSPESPDPECTLFNEDEEEFHDAVEEKITNENDVSSNSNSVSSSVLRPQIDLREDSSLGNNTCDYSNIIDEDS